MSNDLTVKRGIKKSLYLTALVITIAVFAVGILVGFQLSSAVSNQFTRDLETIQTSSVNPELLSLLDTNDTTITNAVCASLTYNIQKIASQTTDLGQRLEVLEKKQTKQNPEVQFLKEQYFALEARDFLLFKKLKEKCNSEYQIVLYFYGDQSCNTKLPCEQAIQAAEQELAELKNENKGQLLIYSFDADYAQTSPSVAALKSAYAQGMVPRIIKIQ